MSQPFARLEWVGRGEIRLPQPAQLTLDSVVHGSSDEDTGARPRLIQGENLAVMQALKPNWSGKIDLIYADPPFLTGKAYSARVGRGEDSREPDSWETALGYRDQWDDGAAYLSMLYSRLRAMYELLAPTGSLYLHLDWHASAYARVLLDEIFGPDRLLNEIVWTYHGPSPIRSAFKRKHDTILVYTKSADYTFNADAVRVPYADSTVKTFASSDKAGFGKEPDLERGKVPEDWWYFPVVARLHSERTGYPTQKPEALLERIVLASSNPGDVVADFFCGSGTVPAVAEQHGRRWIACDLAELAVRTTYRRMLLMEPRPGFEFWKAQDIEDASDIGLAWRSGEDGLVEIAEISASQAPQSFPENIIYWEVDPAYDGSVFRSRYSVARGWREDRLSTTLDVGPDTQLEQAAVRAVDTLGAVGLATDPSTD